MSLYWRNQTQNDVFLIERRAYFDGDTATWSYCTILPDWVIPIKLSTATWKKRKTREWEIRRETNSQTGRCISLLMRWCKEHFVLFCLALFWDHTWQCLGVTVSALRNHSWKLWGNQMGCLGSNPSELRGIYYLSAPERTFYDLILFTAITFSEPFEKNILRNWVFI